MRTIVFDFAIVFKLGERLVVLKATSLLGLFLFSKISKFKWKWSRVHLCSVVKLEISFRKLLTACGYLSREMILVRSTCINQGRAKYEI